MFNRILLAGLGLVIIVSLIACGEKENLPGAISTTNLLPDKLTEIEITRAGESSLFVGDSLYEYINGGAEIYHQYDFVEVATATYTYKQIEIIADIYRFTESNGAYGLYSVLRPEEEEYLSLGVEGFGSESSRDFVKGEYMIRVIGYDASDDTKTAVNALAGYFAKTIPGTIEKPSMYSNLPTDMIVPGTDKYIIESFMGHTFLTRVYTQNYDLNGNILQIFISTNPEDKFAKWRGAIEASGTEFSVDDTINIPPDRSFVFEDGFYGNIVVGIMGDYLVGAIDYKPEQTEFINSWLTALNK
ncbi:MAG: DUF6599 family protein [candidate division Zixibacteria bacterium]